LRCSCIERRWPSVVASFSLIQARYLNKFKEARG
jgi:hypothetical protein